MIFIANHESEGAEKAANVKEISCIHFSSSS